MSDVDVDPQVAYCAEEGCHQLATTERFEGMIGEDVVVILTCENHGPEWLRP